MRHSQFASRHLNKRPASVLQQPLPHILPEPPPTRAAPCVAPSPQSRCNSTHCQWGSSPNERKRRSSSTIWSCAAYAAFCERTPTLRHLSRLIGAYSYGVDYAPHHLLMRCRQEAQGPYVASRGAQHALVADSMSLRYVRARVKALVDPGTRDSGAPGKRRVENMASWPVGLGSSVRQCSTSIAAASTAERTADHSAVPRVTMSSSMIARYDKAAQK